MVLHRSGLLLLSSSSGLVAVLPVLSGCALRRSLAVRRAVISLHPAGHFGSDQLVSPLPHYCWSRIHGHASAGLLVESQRWGCCSWFYRASWLVGGRKWIRKSTTTGTEALTGATLLPRHQPQKIFHLDWYNREEDSLRTPDNTRAALPEKPDFR